MQRENIDNLTSLWKTVGAAAHAYHPGPDFDYCAVDYSEWPNRLWFHAEITDDALRAAKAVLQSTPTKLRISHWGIHQDQPGPLFESHGFEQLSEQVAMVLKLTQAYEPAGALTVEKVGSRGAAELWEQLFQQAFRYRIDHRLLLLPYDNVDFYIVRHNGAPIGTFLLHHNQEHYIGIHSVGVIPEMRGRGFAQQVMMLVLNQALERGFGYATLQASAMGKGIYLKLGFEEQFVIRNYGLA